MEFINNWSAGDVELRDLSGTKALYFLSNDFIINSADIANPATIKAEWVFKGLDFGIIMKYNYSGFLLYTLNGSYATLSLITNDSDQYYGHILKGTPYTCNVDEIITISAEITESTYKFYANDYLVFSTKIEDSSLSSGYAGLFSHTGNYCKSFSVYSEVPTGWVFDEPTDKYIGRLGDEA